MKYIFVFLFLFSCKNDYNGLDNSLWKIYNKSSKEFGDVFNFSNLMIRNDTVFFENKPKYKIIEYKTRYFMDEFITIKSLKTQSVATYIRK